MGKKDKNKKKGKGAEKTIEKTQKKLKTKLKKETGEVIIIHHFALKYILTAFTGLFIG